MQSVFTTSLVSFTPWPAAKVAIKREVTPGTQYAIGPNTIFYREVKISFALRNK